VKPALLLCVGTLAHARFLRGRGLDEIVGRAWDVHGLVIDGAPRTPPALLPLPHPSGQSRWLNDPAHVALLERALERLETLAQWAETTTAPAPGGQSP
jgi:uracil-DNA glycosylase